MREWRVNKSVYVPYAGKVVFMTLYEDLRDVMSDSVRPEWGVSPRVKNRRVEWCDSSGRVVAREVDRDTGNEMYRKVVAVSRPGSGFPPAILAKMFEGVD